jgi:hypothetical protein
VEEPQTKLPLPTQELIAASLCNLLLLFLNYPLSCKYDYIHVETLKTREITINESFLQEPGIGPKLVLSAAEETNL